MHPILVSIHIIAGSLALVAGAVALSTKKGQHRHRQSGKVFFWSMLPMAGLGAYGSTYDWELISVLNGLLTCYLVLTGWLTVARKPNDVRSSDIALLVLIVAIAAAHITLGIKAARSPEGAFQGFLPIAYFVFGGVALIAAVMDIRKLINKGVFGHHRIARHLWRMCFAFFIAAASLFGGQPQVFPEAIRNTLWLAAPVLIIVLATLYWLFRVLFGQQYKKKRYTLNK